MKGSKQDVDRLSVSSTPSKRYSLMSRIKGTQTTPRKSSLERAETSDSLQQQEQLERCLALEAKVSELKESLKTLQEKHVQQTNKLSSERDQAHMMVDQVSEELTKVCEEKHQIEQKASQLALRMEECDAIRDALQTQTSQLEEELETSEKTLEREQLQHNKDIRAVEAARDELSLSLTQLAAQNRDLLEQKAMSTEKASMQVRGGELHAQIESLGLKVAQMQTERIGLLNKLQHMTQELIRLQNEKTCLACEQKSLENHPYQRAECNSSSYPLSLLDKDEELKRAVFEAGNLLRANAINKSEYDQIVSAACRASQVW